MGGTRASALSPVSDVCLPPLMRPLLWGPTEGEPHSLNVVIPAAAAALLYMHAALIPADTAARGLERRVLADVRGRQVRPAPLLTFSTAIQPPYILLKIRRRLHSALVCKLAFAGAAGCSTPAAAGVLALAAVDRWSVVSDLDLGEHISRPSVHKRFGVPSV